MQRLFSEPPIELVAAPVAWRRRSLVAALRVVAGAREADVKMVVVTPPRPYLRQPAAVGARFAAQLALDRGIDENSFDRRLAREGFEQKPVARGPGRPIDLAPIRCDHVDRRDLVALGGAQATARHRREPDIGVESDLMRAVAGQHRAAARLGDVADKKPP